MNSKTVSNVRHKVHRRYIRLQIGFSLLIATCVARADVGPPVTIRLAPETVQAESGRDYFATFEIQVYKPGSISGFKLEGEGWTVIEFDPPADHVEAKAGILRIPFRARPEDANLPIRLSFSFEGRIVSRSYEVGPAFFARRGKAAPAVQVAPGIDPAIQQNAERVDDTDASQNEKSGTPRGGAIMLRFTGRFGYQRPVALSGGMPTGPTTFEGAHGLHVEVFDEDDIDDESIWSGFTDANGYFDSPPIEWDDCDVLGCDDPDLYVVFTCDSGIVQVQDPSMDEDPYTWSTVDSVIDNFTGTTKNFGSFTAETPAKMPALHILTSITRAHAFILNRVGVNTPHVDLIWPDATNAFYVAEEERIHVSNARQWQEATHTHEYGHHFLYRFALTTPPDYCNGFCDIVGPPLCTDVGHCPWCEETDHDAFNEGWPNWLADIITRYYPIDYQLSNGDQLTALATRSQENLNLCGEDSQSHNPMFTEGFLGALLRDIEDATQDEHDNDGDGMTDFDGITDSLCLGWDEIFDVVLQDKPTTPAEFITDFLARYPEHSNRFWATAFNVHPAYTMGFFPPDAAPPGAVTSCDSPSHPLGVGGNSPCITVEWEPAADDVTGSCAYSYLWSQNPSGLVPDMVAESVNTTGCLPSVSGGPFEMADWYFSVRAQDCAGNWSTLWDTFGPFTRGECNNNGIIDACEVACDISTLGLSCGGDPSYCTTNGAMCGFASDCNTNAVPDECDIATSSSEDCNEDGVPDECQAMRHYTGLAESPISSNEYDADSNWFELVRPSNGDHVCIRSGIPTTNVMFKESYQRLSSLSCEIDFSINGLDESPDLELNGPSFIDGDFSMIHDAKLLSTHHLAVGGTFHWSDAEIRFGGTTTVANGMTLTPPDNFSLLRNGHHLWLTGGSATVNGKFINMSSRPGSPSDPT